MTIRRRQSYVTAKNIPVSSGCYPRFVPCEILSASNSAGFCFCTMTNARLREEHQSQQAKCPHMGAELFYMDTIYGLSIFFGFSVLLNPTNGLRVFIAGPSCLILDCLWTPNATRH